MDERNNEQQQQDQLQQQQQQQQQQQSMRRVTPDSPPKENPPVERRPSRLEEDISEAIMPSYKTLGCQSKAQTNTAAARQAPHQQFGPEALLRSYLQELQSRRQLCAQYNGGQLDLATAEILNTIGLHYHHVTNDQDSALMYHMEALGALGQIASALLGPASPRSQPFAAADNPPPLPGSTVLTAEQKAKLKEASVQMAITYTDVGNVYKWRGNDGDALRAYHEALAVFREIGLPDEHPRVEATLRGVRLIGQHFEADASALPSYHDHSNTGNR